MSLDLPFTPRLMKTPHAAQYLGISATKLRGLSIPAKVDGGNRLYDRMDLDEYANGLPYEGRKGSVEESDSCEIADEAFG